MQLNKVKYKMHKILINTKLKYKIFNLICDWGYGWQFNSVRERFIKEKYLGKFK